MKKAKTLVAGLLALCLTAGLTAPAFAGEVTVYDSYGDPYTIGSNEFTVKFNGETVVFPDAQPFAVDNRTLVPIRFVAQTMGADVKWDQPTETAVITKGGTTVEITIGEKALRVTRDGETSTVQMDTVAVGRDGRTFIPVRFVAEALGAWVGYSDLFTTAQIYQDQLIPEEITRLHGYYDMTWVESLKATGEWDKSAWAKEETDESWEAFYPHIKYFVGANGFANANEWKMRTPSGQGAQFPDGRWISKPKNYVGTVTGGTFTYGTQPDIEFAKLVLAEAVQGINQDIPKAGTLEANLRADLSGVYASRHSSRDAGTYVRGVLDVTIPKGADMAWIRRNCDFISNPKEGESRSIDVEVYVNTFSEEVYWQEMLALK